MKRVLWMVALLIATLPMAAYANTIDFANQGGTISGSASMGLTLSSPITSVTGLSGFTSGMLTIMTGAFSGSFPSNGTFGAGSIAIMSNVFTETFLFNSASWMDLGGGVFLLSIHFGNGDFSGQFIRNDGTLTAISGDTNIVTPEPGTLGLLGTGLVAVSGLVRRKLKRG
jgi:hypothetical protein